MDFNEALKKVQNKKPKDNFILLELDYSKKLILPYKDGITFLSTLVNAEQLTTEYNKQPVITGINKDQFSASILSALEYEQIKIAALLNVTLDVVKENYKEVT